MAFVSFKHDYAFRELFSNENVRKQFLSDVLETPLEEIASVRVVSPYLRRRFRRQKLGILDMNMEMRDGTKVNIEMQTRCQKHWVRRQLFYLTRMYSGDLKEGQEYAGLQKCVSISILDFNLIEDKEYHSVYRLRDKLGRELTDLLEIHIIELCKKLEGMNAVNDWIRLFNAESEEDLEMIEAKNLGITEAIELLKNMNLRKSFRYLYEERLKAIRDRQAEDECVWDQGREQGRVEGKAEAILQLLDELGDMPSDLRVMIMAEKDMDTLNRWLKAAARAESIEQYREWTVK